MTPEQYREKWAPRRATYPDGGAEELRRALGAKQMGAPPRRG